MEDNLTNRMAEPRRRGRPTNAEIEARKSGPVEQVTVAMPVTGIRCLHCGKGMIPRVLRTEGAERTVSCALCGRRMLINYDAAGRPGTASCI